MFTLNLGRAGKKNREMCPVSLHSTDPKYFAKITWLLPTFAQSQSLLAVFYVGPQPIEQYGTRASFGLSPSIDTSRWSAAVTSPPGDTVELSICCAPDAPIGRYRLTLGRSGQIEFILLFNPWCPGG